jgi:hypothetical protein
MQYEKNDALEERAEKYKMLNKFSSEADSLFRIHAT